MVHRLYIHISHKEHHHDSNNTYIQLQNTKKKQATNPRNFGKKTRAILHKTITHGHENQKNKKKKEDATPLWLISI